DKYLEESKSKNRVPSITGLLRPARQKKKRRGPESHNAPRRSDSVRRQAKKSPISPESMQEIRQSHGQIYQILWRACQEQTPRLKPPQIRLLLRLIADVREMGG